MKPKLKKAVYSKQGTNLFAIIFALMAILGFISILSPEVAEQVPASEEAFSSRTIYSGYLLRVVIVTVTMIVILIVGLKFYKKRMKISGKDNLNMNVLGRHYISDKQYLLKVMIEDKYLLLGISESNISYLTQLAGPVDDPDEKTATFGTILDLETDKASKA